MDENIEPTGSTGMDRRTLIKRAGIVGAGVAVWSAPSVTSLASRAYAAGSVSTSCKTAGTCASGFVECNPTNHCYCFQLEDGSGHCTQDWLCGSTPACDPNTPCPSGYTCIYNSCCGTPYCAPDCTNTTGASVGHGHWASGRSN